jgi:broad specificity phosphatase PhoE
MLILLRHGLTEWNKSQIFRGQRDISLSNEGRKQAHLTGEYLKDKNIVTIYTSPLKRAYETSSIIANEIKCDTTVVKGLTDIHYGDWESKSLKWVIKNDPDTYAVYREHPEKIVFPNGESLKSCSKRAFSSFSHLALQIYKLRENSTHNFLFVTHRVILKLLLLRALDLTPSSFWKLQVDVCGLNELDFKNKSFLIKSINSVCHLEKPKESYVDF